MVFGSRQRNYETPVGLWNIPLFLVGTGDREPTTENPQSNAIYKYYIVAKMTENEVIIFLCKQQTPSTKYNATETNNKNR